MKQVVKEGLKKTPFFGPLKEMKILYMNLVPKRTISKKYRQFYGKTLSWNEPKYLSEKMQLLKLNIYPNNSKVIKAADKYTIHEYLDSVGLRSFSTPFIEVYNKTNEFKIEKLPKKFVLKQTNSSGNMIIVKDKDTVNEANLKKEINRWFISDYGSTTLEPHYSKSKNRVICEPFFENLGDEYRIFMVSGQIGYIQVIVWDWSETENPKLGNEEIIKGHGRHERIYCDKDFNILWKDSNLSDVSKVAIPDNWEQLVQVSKKISEDFPVVRIDFNKIDDTFKITELTFTPANCYLDILKENDELDLALGQILSSEDYL